LERNKTLSIFLRVLEYYEGVMFLTTDRVKQIDDAFHSRIHVTLDYPSLSTDPRKSICCTFLGAHSVVEGSELDGPAEAALNGHQIENMVKTAQMLARSQRSSGVDIRHIETILAVEGSSRQML